MGPPEVSSGLVLREPHRKENVMAMTSVSEDRPADARVGSPAIVVRGLTKRFGDVTAVQELSFEVRPGRVTGFLGPNGAGKSTTLRMLLGLVHPTAGDATILGMPYTSLDRPTRTVGAVLETQGFHPARSGRNHLRAIAAAAGLPEGRVEVVLDHVGLASAAGRKIGKYSLGMRQRLGLASALLGDPTLLVLDEPANGLDPHGIRWLREFLRGFASRGNAVLVSSHLLAEVAQMVDDVIVIHRGRLVRQGSVDDLTSCGSVLRVASPELERLTEVLVADGADVQRVADRRLTVRGTSVERVGALALAAGIPLLELTKEQGLEDVFLEMTNGTEGER
jgi:ABC-2 type transport system ATP-binding protein